MTNRDRDETILDTPIIRSFIAETRARLADFPRDPAKALNALEPRFAELLADPNWLPDEFARANPTSGMGGGIGQWLLFRAGDGSLSLFSLVIPPGQTTPVHDHLAWGLVGLYHGEQTETVYRRLDDGTQAEHANLVVEERRSLRPGDFYLLLPPDADIHDVTTTSAVPSISIHLLGNDAGCVWRHAFDPDRRTVRAFRSGYSNRECEGGTSVIDSTSSTPRVVSVRPQPLTPEAFAPYGSIVDGGKTLIRSTEYPIFGGLMTLQPAEREVRQINRHHDHNQLFAPVDQEPMLLIVAPPHVPGEAFDPEQIAAFVTDGRTAVVLHVDTWHTAPRALGSHPIRALNVQATNNHVHTELIDIERVSGCRVELVLDP